MIVVLGDISDYGQYLLLVGVVLVLASLVMGIRKKRNRAATRITAREHLERYKEKAAVRDDLASVMVEVEQLAKRLGAQLDAKTIALEKLIDEADRKIRQLEALHGRARPAAPLSEPPQPPPSPVPNSPLPQDDLTRSIYALADEGKPAGEIARQLDEHVGKVELILALRNA